MAMRNMRLWRRAIESQRLTSNLVDSPTELHGEDHRAVPQHLFNKRLLFPVDSEFASYLKHLAFCMFQ